MYYNTIEVTSEGRIFAYSQRKQQEDLKGSNFTCQQSPNWHLTIIYIIRCEVYLKTTVDNCRKPITNIPFIPGLKYS